MFNENSIRVFYWWVLCCALLIAATSSSFGKEYRCLRFTVHEKSTSAIAVNSQGTIVGTYVDDSGRPQGFLRTSNGDISELQYPGAVSTRPTGINDEGDVAGTFIDAQGSVHGFVRTSNGSFAEFLPPLPSTEPPFSSVREVRTGGINNQGEISGTLFTALSGNSVYPFIRRADDSFHLYDVAVVREGGTPTGMNDVGIFFVSHANSLNRTPLTSCVGGPCGSPSGILTAYSPLPDLIARAIAANNDNQWLGNVEYAPLRFHAPYEPGPKATFIQDKTTGEVENVVCPAVDPFKPVFNGISNDGKLAGQIDGQGVVATPTGRTAELRLSETVWTFASHALGSTSGTGRIYVYNQGNAPAHVVKLYVTPFAPEMVSPEDNYANEAFQIVENNCQGELSPGRTCDFSFTFKPNQVGLNEAKINVASDGKGAVQQISVQGIGSGSAFYLAYTSASFPPTAVGSQAYPATFYPYNYGDTPGSLGLLPYSGDAQDFILLKDTCGASVAAYKTCALVFAFKPTAAGRRTTTVKFAEQTITLTGLGY